MITDPVRRIVEFVRGEFAADFDAGNLYSLGVYNRRYIAGTTTWSQHAWGNAWDIGVKTIHRPELGDRVLAFLRSEDRVERLHVGLILWQVRDHFDHLHVEGDPKMTGTPPVTGTTTSNGSEGMMLQNGDRGDAVALFQRCLVNTGASLKVDGIFGPITEGAVRAYQRKADIGESGRIDGVTAALLIRYERTR